MTDGHWRRGEEEGMRVGVGGYWHRFKVLAGVSGDIGLNAKSGGMRRDAKWI